MSYRIAVCDDIAEAGQTCARIAREWAGSRNIPVLVETFSSAEQFLFRYAEEKRFDILLLDIEMGGMDGVALARRIRQENQTVQIIFVTGYSDYIADGYDVAALHYLMKPVDPEKLFTVLDRALDKRRREDACLNLEWNGEMLRIPLYEIQYLDVHQNYVTVHCKSDYTVKRPLVEFERMLDDRFFRVGRGLVVNLTLIRRVSKTDVYLSTGAVLPLPRGAYEPLNRAIIART